jgi:hypothetical protein
MYAVPVVVAVAGAIIMLRRLLNGGEGDEFEWE